jgi:hypothetical protein
MEWGDAVQAGKQKQERPVSTEDRGYTEQSMQGRDRKTTQSGRDQEEQADEWEHVEGLILVEYKIGQLGFGLDCEWGGGDYALTKLTATTVAARVGGSS